MRNTFDFAFDKTIVLASESANVRRQQLKLLKIFKEHMDSTYNLFEEDDRISTLITSVLTPKSEMTLKPLTEEEKTKLLVRPDFFQPDGVVDKDAFHFGPTHDSYSAFIRKEERDAAIGANFRAEKAQLCHPFFKIPDLNKCGFQRCSGCGNLMMDCHDVTIGTYCVYRVIHAINNNIDMVDDVVIKKVFIDTYNRCLAFIKFKNGKGTHEDWVFPPPCVQHNSYSYAVFFYEWIVEGRWRMEKKNKGNDGEEEESDY